MKRPLLLRDRGGVWVYVDDVLDIVRVALGAVFAMFWLNALIRAVLAVFR